MKYQNLQNYRKITVEFNGYRANGSGPYVKFIDDYVNIDSKTKTRVVYFDNLPSESMPEFALRKLTEAGFKVVAKCTGKSGHSFLCDNWGDKFTEIKNIK